MVETAGIRDLIYFSTMSLASSTKISARETASREECLESLDKFIEECQENITSMLDAFGWTPEHFIEPRNPCTCPYDSGHRMPKASLDKHKVVCEKVSQGYSKEDANRILEDQSYCYKDASCIYSVKLDLDTINSVLWNHHVQNHSVFYGYNKLPQTPEEEQQLLNREDRLGMAEYIVKRAKEANRLKELGHDELMVSENLADLIKKENEERKLDPVEEMAALRDYRRRRQTYRAKNVHITKKSHTEIMREVINNQMEMYTQSLKDEMGESQIPQVGENLASSSCPKVKERYERYDMGVRSRYLEHRDRSSKRAHKSRSRSPDRESRTREKSKEKRFIYRSRSRSEDRKRTKHKDKKRSRSISSSEERSHYERSRSRSLNRDSRTRDKSVDKRSKYRSRSRSDATERFKHKYKRSRSISSSEGRGKKSKHKKKKHKHKKHKKSDRKHKEVERETETEKDSRQKEVESESEESDSKE